MTSVTVDSPHPLPLIHVERLFFPAFCFLIITPFSCSPTLFTSPPDAVRVQLLLSALLSTSRGEQGRAGQRSRKGREKRVSGKYEMIFSHFWEAVGVVLDYLNRCYPNFFSVLPSSASLEKH